MRVRRYQFPQEFLRRRLSRDKPGDTPAAVQKRRRRRARGRLDP